MFNRIGKQSLALSRPPDDTLDGFFLPGDSFSVTFARPISAVGIFFNTTATLTAGDLFINTPAGAAGTGGPVSNYDAGGLFFAGLISDSSFSTATFGAVGGGHLSSGFNVDDLTYAVPEPSYLLLLSGAFAGFAIRIARYTSRGRK